MSGPHLLSTFDDPDRRFAHAKVSVDAGGRCVVVGRSAGGELWSWSPSGGLAHHPFGELDPVDAHLFARYGRAHMAGVHAAAWFEGRTVVLTGSGHHEPENGDGPPGLPGPGSMVHLWDLASGTKIAGPFGIEYGGEIGALALRPHEGRLIGLAGTENCDAAAWDVIGGEPAGGLSETIGESVDAVELAEVDGRLLGVAGSLDHNVWTWNVHGRSGYEIWELPHGPSSVAVSEWRGRPVVLAAGGFPEVRLWDVRDREELPHRLACGEEEIFTVSVLSHGERVFALTDAEPGSGDVMRLFDLDGGEVIHPQVTDGMATGVLGRHGGRPIAVVTDDEGLVHVWDLGGD